ncbi:Fibroblast growth factor receptor 4 [Desmophyllum pertusum]|uniref:Fibroblast growth factor receptor 4 n=1 Tax=Desmophyllum pertusum TaxID=174260 RepID=A0A9X0CFT8_9CNID|nr:Fibroblast growth factor receptor 4 [Desmophyllum pertusum]
MPKFGDDLKGSYHLIDPHYYNTIQVKDNYGVELRFTNVTEDDFGLYTCFVSNHIGKDYNSAFLSKGVNDVKPTVPVRVTERTLGITAMKTTEDSRGTASVEGFHARKAAQAKRDRIRVMLFV